MKEQNHPLYNIDRENIDRLLAKHSPEDSDLVDLARLLNRYDGFPGASDLHADMEKILKFWEISREQLNDRAREIWEGGFRPGRQVDDVLGSGFDTSDAQEN